MNDIIQSRRQFIKSVLGSSAKGLLLAALPFTSASLVSTVQAQTSADSLPPVGMGTWITFNVGSSERLIQQRSQVLQAFFDHGGGMIDSSPMYGSAEAVIGKCLKRVGKTETMFSATKVWTSGRSSGVNQMRESMSLWDIPRFDLIQIHNLLDWEEHYRTLREWKQAGLIRYWGITTSHRRRHGLFEKIMLDHQPDFVQFTYNILDREAENRLLPISRERNIKVIINRPFQGGWLMDRYQSKPLPEWSRDIGCNNWSEYFLKFILSHPAVTCAIPATSQVEHMHENMKAGRKPYPSSGNRQRMINYIESL